RAEGRPSGPDDCTQIRVTTVPARNRSLVLLSYRTASWLRPVEARLLLGAIAKVGREGLRPSTAIRQVVGALRVHPHKHDANYPFQKIEDLPEAGASRAAETTLGQR